MARDSNNDTPSSSGPSNPHIREAQDRFVATWGQAGSTWGISRTMAEVHALLYITADSLCTDDVMERLQISRGNASMSLRALQDWGIISRVHKRGDRKEYFEAEQDVWAMFKTIARERKKREIDTVTASLYEIRDLTPDAKSLDDDVKAHNERMDEMLEFFQTITHLSDALIGPKGAGLRAAFALLSKAK